MERPRATVAAQEPTRPSARVTKVIVQLEHSKRRGKCQRYVQSRMGTDSRRAVDPRTALAPKKRLDRGAEVTDGEGRPKKGGRLTTSPAYSSSDALPLPLLSALGPRLVGPETVLGVGLVRVLSDDTGTCWFAPPIPALAALSLPTSDSRESTTAPSVGGGPVDEDAVGWLVAGCGSSKMASELLRAAEGGMKNSLGGFAGVAVVRRGRGTVTGGGMRFLGL